MNKIKSDKLHLLLIEDINTNGNSIDELFNEDNKYEINKVNSLEEAVKLLDQTEYDLSVYNISNLREDEIEKLSEAQLQKYNLPFIVIGKTKNGLHDTLIRKVNADDFIINQDLTKQTLEKVFNYNHRIHRLNHLLNTRESKFKELVRKNADPMIVVDQEWDTILINNKAETLIEFTSLDKIIDAAKNCTEIQKITELKIPKKEKEDLIIQLKILDAYWDSDLVKIISLRDISELKSKQKRIVQLNKLLKTISNINQLIVVEKNRTKLLQKACDLLIEGRSYQTAWFALYEEDGKKINRVVHSGIDDRIEQFNNYINSEEYLNCLATVAKSDAIFNRIELADTCEKCPLSDNHKNNEVLSVKITYERKNYGLLVVSRSLLIGNIKEENDLLKEVAADLGLALYTIEMEEQQKVGEKKLKESERFAKSTIDAMSGHIAVINRDGEIVAVNKAWKTFAKKYASDIQKVLEGSNYIEACKNAVLRGDQSTEIVLEKLQKVINGKLERFSHEYPCFSEGYREWFKVTVTRFAGDGPVRIVVSHDNITELKKSLEKITQSEERYRSLFENSTVGIYRASLDGKILLANQPFLNMMQVDSIEEFQKRLDKNLVYADPSINQKFHEVLRKEGTIYGFDNELKLPDENRLFIRESAKIVEYDGEYYNEGVIENITEQKLFEQQLIEARNKAERSDRLKTEFLAQMSHEIRTPLNAMLSAIELVKEESHDYLSMDSKEAFKIIESSGNRIINTIQEILDMSELQAESYEVINSNFNLLEEIVYPTLQNYRKNLNEKNIEVNVNASESNMILFLDRYSIMQIFHHIFDNAYKYTNSGNIVVNINKNETELIIEVNDTGIGISEEYLNRIFDPFSQESQGYSRPYDGCGLGLALTKRYCELLSGRISIRSERGKGTSVKVVIPVANH